MHPCKETFHRADGKLQPSPHQVDESIRLMKLAGPSCTGHINAHGRGFQAFRPTATAVGSKDLLKQQKAGTLRVSSLNLT